MALKGCRTNAIAYRSDERPLFARLSLNLKPTSRLAVDYNLAVPLAEFGQANVPTRVSTSSAISL
jgi:hypothetical protein